MVRSCVCSHLSLLPRGADTSPRPSLAHEPPPLGSPTESRRRKPDPIPAVSPRRERGGAAHQRCASGGDRLSTDRDVGQVTMAILDCQDRSLTKCCVAAYRCHPQITPHTHRGRYHSVALTPGRTRCHLHYCAPPTAHDRPFRRRAGKAQVGNISTNFEMFMPEAVFATRVSAQQAATQQIGTAARAKSASRANGGTVLDIATVEVGVVRTLPATIWASRQPGPPAQQPATQRRHPARARRGHHTHLRPGRTRPGSKAPLRHPDPQPAATIVGQPAHPRPTTVIWRRRRAAA